MFLMDTDVFTLFQTGDVRVAANVADCHEDQLAISIITVEEVLNGWYSRLRRRNSAEQTVAVYSRLQSAVEFCSRVRILPCTLESVEIFATLRCQAPNVGPNDLRIVAIALVAGRPSSPETFGTSAASPA